MARPRATLLQRGRLYAAKRVGSEPLFDGKVTSGGSGRMRLALGWVAGYKAAQNDAREARRGRR